MAIATYTQTGNAATKPATLDSSVFGLEVKNHDLLKQAYTTYLANGRENLSVVKTRGLVSGGGRKPWKQKGTGRARFGSTRNPIWRGGGIVFGPTGEENYTKQLNVKAKRLAIRQALSMAAQENKVVVIEDLVSTEGKTAEFAQLLQKVAAVKNVLVVVEHKTAELVRASSNLQNIILVQANYVNTYNVLNADTVLFTRAALKVTTDWLGDNK